MTQNTLDLATLRFTLESVLASLTMDPTRSVDDLKSEREAATAMLGALQPRDAVQSALAARAVSMHHASMECYRRAAKPGVPDAMVARLFASGLSLARMSLQMIKALDQRKARDRAAAARVNPIEAILAAAAARKAQEAEWPAAGAQDPTPSEPTRAEAAPRPASPKHPSHQPAPARRPAQPAAAAASPTATIREEIAAMTGLADAA